MPVFRFLSRQQFVRLVTGFDIELKHLKRDSRCPLVPLPNNHGRLIDADRLRAMSKSAVPYEYRGAPFPEIIKLIENEPTVVDAEG